MKIYLPIILFVVILIGGCDSLSSNEKSIDLVTIQTDKEIYASTQKVTVSFINNTSNSVFLNACGTILERYENDSWSTFDAATCTAIPREPISIEAGSQFEFTLVWFNDEDYQEGEYRFIFDLEDSSGELISFEQRKTDLVIVKN